MDHLLRELHQQKQDFDKEMRAYNDLIVVQESHLIRAESEKRSEKELRRELEACREQMDRDRLLVQYFWCDVGIWPER